MQYLKNIFPIFTWLPHYQKAYLTGDLSAGLTVGIMLIPQGMAYALIAGLPPVYGLYASIVPQVIYALLGTSRQLSVAPVAMDSLLVAAGVSLLATQGSEAYISYAILLAFFMGLFQFILGVLKLGFITNLLSKPVISGFTSAAAIIIGLNQLKYLLGIEISKSNKAYEIIWDTILKVQDVHLITLSIGVAGILIISGIKKINNQIPGALIAVILGIILVYSFGLHLEGVSIVETIPSGLPKPTMPDLSMEAFQELIPLAITISVVAYMEAYSVAKAIEAKKRDHKVMPNKELIALGASNFIGAFFYSFPVTGGFSRSAVNYQSGANTPLSSVISASLVLLTLIFLTPLFYFLPKAILASVIMVAIVKLIDISYVQRLWYERKIELALLFVTFFVTLFFSMVPGILSGVIFSILILLYRLAYPHIARLGRVKGHHEFRNVKRFKELEMWDDLLILRVDAPLTFINIQYFKDYIFDSLHRSSAKINVLILDAGPISYVDATAVEGIIDLLKSLQEQGVTLMISDLVGPVRDTFNKTGLINQINPEYIFLDLDSAVKYAVNKEKGAYASYAIQSNE